MPPTPTGNRGGQLSWQDFRRLDFPKTWFPKIFEARQPTHRRREHHMNLPDQKRPGNRHG
jgi:hypothetical protein